MNTTSQQTTRFDPSHPTYNLSFCMQEAGGECHCKRCRLWAETHSDKTPVVDDANVLWF